jgi:hypothetical protein
VASYLGLDFYFMGLGQWRPDPSRVAWGVIGKIHPPRSASVHRVLPGWLRPDASSVAFREQPAWDEAPALMGVSRFRGKPVVLHVLGGGRPLLHECQDYFRALKLRMAGTAEVHLILLAGSAPERPLVGWTAECTGLMLATPEGSRSLRPLGEMREFPMTFVLDRRGRIRQRWVGFGEALTEEALRGALAER